MKCNIMCVVETLFLLKPSSHNLTHKLWKKCVLGVLRWTEAKREREREREEEEEDWLWTEKVSLSDEKERMIEE